MATVTMTLEEGVKAQRALRDAAGLPDEEFPPRDFIRMIGDEIDALHAAGTDDAEIARIVSDATGKDFPADAIAEHHQPDGSGHGG